MAPVAKRSFGESLCCFATPPPNMPRSLQGQGAAQVRWLARQGGLKGNGFLLSVSKLIASCSQCPKAHLSTFQAQVHNRWHFSSLNTSPLSSSPFLPRPSLQHPLSTGLEEANSPLRVAPSSGMAALLSLGLRKSARCCDVLC